MSWENILKKKPTDEEISAYENADVWQRDFFKNKKAIEKEIKRRNAVERRQQRLKERLEQKVKPPSKAERMKLRHQKERDKE